MNARIALGIGLLLLAEALHAQHLDPTAWNRVESDTVGGEPIELDIYITAKRTI